MGKLRVEVTTGTRDRAGTDDPIWADLGGVRVRLNHAGVDDFEIGARNVFSLDVPGLLPTQIWRVVLMKAPDGKYGGWLLDGVDVVLDGEVIHKQAGIAKWIQDESRVWTATGFDPTGPVPPAMRIPESLVEEQISAAVKAAAKAKQLKGLRIHSVDVRLEPTGMRITVRGTKSVDGAPDPDITVTLKYDAPVLKNGKLTLHAKSTNVDVDFPFWFDFLTGGIALIVGEIASSALEAAIEQAATRILEAELNRELGVAASKISHVRFFPRSVEIALRS